MTFCGLKHSGGFWSGPDFPTAYLGLEDLAQEPRWRRLCYLARVTVLFFSQSCQQAAPIASLSQVPFLPIVALRVRTVPEGGTWDSKTQREGCSPLGVNPFHNAHRAQHGLEPRVDGGDARDSG